MIRFIRDREIGMHHHLPLKTPDLDNGRLTVNELKGFLEGAPLLQMLYLNNCKGIMNDTKAIISSITKLKDLQVLDLQRTAFVQPSEVMDINTHSPS